MNTLNKYLVLTNKYTIYFKTSFTKNTHLDCWVKTSKYD